MILKNGVLWNQGCNHYRYWFSISLLIHQCRFSMADYLTSHRKTEDIFITVHAVICAYTLSPSTQLGSSQTTPTESIPFSFQNISCMGCSLHLIDLNSICPECCLQCKKKKKKHGWIVQPYQAGGRWIMVLSPCYFRFSETSSRVTLHSLQQPVSFMQIISQTFQGRLFICKSTLNHLPFSL